MCGLPGFTDLGIKLHEDAVDMKRLISSSVSSDCVENIHLDQLLIFGEDVWGGVRGCETAHSWSLVFVGLSICSP